MTELPPPDRDDIHFEEDAVERLVGEIVARGAERLGDMAITMLVAIRDALPFYGHGWSRPARDDLLTSVERTATIVLTSLQRNRPPSLQDLRPLTMVGLQRARDGVPQADVTQAIRICRRAGLAFLLREATPAEERPTATVLAAAALISERVDLYLESVEIAIGEGYAESEQHGGRGDPSRREAALVNRLLDGRWRTETDVRDEAERVGRKLGRHHAVLAFLAGKTSKEIPLPESAARVAAELQVGVLLENVRWSPVGHVPAVVSVDTMDEWASLFPRNNEGEIDRLARRHDLVVVVSEPVRDLASMPAIYRRIQQSLPFRAAACIEPGAVTARRLEMFALIAGDASDIGRLIAFVRDVFDPIQREDNADVLFGIVDAFCSVSGQNRWGEIAEARNTHRNTLRPQVQKIENLTKLSFDRIGDVHELVTANRLRRFVTDELDKLDSII